MSTTIESVSRESRVFEPPADWAKRARVPSRAAYDELYRQSIDAPEAFWAEVAKELDWMVPPTKIVEWKPPHSRWFYDGKTNLAHNCLDRHLGGARRNKAALIFEGEPGDVRVLTYWELHREVCRFANVLLKLGVEQGDRVAIYMGMVPEAAIAMLACARIGAVHSVIFGGFAADAVRDRVNDAGVKIVVTQDGAWRRGQIVPLKEQVDKALDACPTVKHTVVLRRTGNDVHMVAGRDHDWHDIVQAVGSRSEPAALDAEHPLFILYTSGTTGKPKGVVHTTGGYMVGTYLSSKLVFDLQDEDVYWCTADVGWVTGHSYIVYGPLANGATVLMYEGAPNHPDPARLWSMIERHGVTIFYTAPTAIRAFVRWGEHHPMKHDLSSLRLLGTVGEPINPEAWVWYWQHIGGERCPIVDTWWQTETGAILISPLPGATTLKPGSATFPLPAIGADVCDDRGASVGIPGGGYLVLTRPWPSMLRGIWGDPERYRQTYWAKFGDRYFAGDGAKRDEDGYFWLLGRVDDVMLVSGHNISTAEVEHALVDHPAVCEAAVVGKTDATTGHAIAAFVILRGGFDPSDELGDELRDHVAHKIGPIAKPKSVLFTDDLPKTRSGKIMRRLLKDVSEDQALGDTTTLADPTVVESIKARYLAQVPEEE
jgi:acetyl-CoA synthetase